MGGTLKKDRRGKNFYDLRGNKEPSGRSLMGGPFFQYCTDC